MERCWETKSWIASKQFYGLDIWRHPPQEFLNHKAYYHHSARDFFDILMYSNTYRESTSLRSFLLHDSLQHIILQRIIPGPHIFHFTLSLKENRSYILTSAREDLKYHTGPSPISLYQTCKFTLQNVILKLFYSSIVHIWWYFHLFITLALFIRWICYTRYSYHGNI